MGDPDSRPLVLFDFDGTLADTWRDIATALNRTLADAGLPGVHDPDVRFWIGEGVIQLLERAVPPEARAPERLEELYTCFRDHYSRCCLDTTRSYAGILDCLESLSEATLAIVSNKPARFLLPLVEQLGLAPYFGVVLGGDSLPMRKPDPRVAEHVLGQLDRVPEEVWVVGDSALDVQLGQAVGAHTIGCAWGLRGPEELRQAGVEVLVERPAQIPPLVLGDPLLGD